MLELTKKLSLRERKYAQTKLSLWRTFLARLETIPYDELKVRDLCEEVEVSEATFFNYYPRKSDLLVYTIMLWSLECSWKVERQSPRKGTRRLIEGVFEWAGEKFVDHPRLAATLTARQALREGPPRFLEVTRAERLLAFPEFSGIEEVPALGIQGILRSILNRGKVRGQLPSRFDVETSVSFLASIFYGVPTVITWHDPGLIPSLYRKQLALAWKGLGIKT